MIRSKRAFSFLFAFSLFALAESVEGRSMSVDFLAGYRGGAGGQAGFTIADFAQDLPLRARFGIGYAGLDPGNAADARKIFINNSTNGIPEESGRTLDFRLDLALPVGSGIFREALIFAGPRYSRFRGNFRYIGGNEDFDVRANQWGIGAGLEGALAVTAATDLVLGGGADFFRESVLTGHDTAYDPDGEDVNAREEYTYGDADEAIHQPEWVFQAIAGFRYRFGGARAAVSAAKDGSRARRTGKRL